MERAMSLGAVPDADMMVMGDIWEPGRQLHTQSGVPVAWVTDRVCGGAGLISDDPDERSAESGLSWFGRAGETFRRWPGLQSFLLSGLDGGTARPWDTGEQVSEPQDTTAIDRMDAAGVLEGWWDAQIPGQGEFAEDEDLREILAPFGGRFPRLAPAVELAGL